MNQFSKSFLIMFVVALFTLALMVYSYRKNLIEPFDQEQAERPTTAVQVYH